MRLIFSSIVLLLLLCSEGTFAIYEHRCIHDELLKKWGGNISFARILPDDSGIKKTAAEAAEGFAPIRIAVFSQDLNSDSRYCTSSGQRRPTYQGTTTICADEDVFSAARKDLLLNYALPSAIKLHAERLKVEPLTASVSFPQAAQGRSICSYFTVPASHATSGVTGGDMYLYVAAGPAGAGVIAWAATCANLGDGRPVFGAMNFSPRYISADPRYIRTATHEMAHALGFNFQAFMQRGLVTSLAVRGKGAGPVVTSASTLTKARAQYGCATAQGMELEDEGGAGTAQSHWERRNAKDELMAGISGIGYYSALTMAVFEDMGFYRANWGAEEPMSWGFNKGCDFLENKCVNEGVTAFTDMFCTATDDNLICTSDRYDLGMCPITTYDGALPPQYQYFADPTVAGRQSDLTDFCPVIVPYSNTGCMDGDTAVMPGSVVGPDARCAKGASLRYRGRNIGDVCVSVSCENETLRIRHLGSDEWVDCTDGARITAAPPFTSGDIICPAYADVCTIQPSNVTFGDSSAETSIRLAVTLTFAAFVLFSLS